MMVEEIIRPCTVEYRIKEYNPATREEMLVEVKPFLELTDPVIEQAHEKILRSGWQGLSVVVGSILFTKHNDEVVLGVCNDGQSWSHAKSETCDFTSAWHAAGNAVQWNSKAPKLATNRRVYGEP